MVFAPLVERLCFRMVERATEVPYRSEVPFLRSPHLSIEVATAVKRFVVIRQFLHEEESR